MAMAMALCGATTSTLLGGEVTFPSRKSRHSSNLHSQSFKSRSLHRHSLNRHSHSLELCSYGRHGRRLRAAASDVESETQSVPAEDDSVGAPVDASADSSPSSSSVASVYSESLSKKEKLALRSSGKQILSLRFLWMEKNIGIALDQVIPGYGSIPLSPFYFWPKKDAWEELKAKLESKPWISKRRTIILLNQATDIINLWQQKASTF